MAQTFPLQTLLELMQNRSDEATRTLGQLIAAEQSQRSRLEMLEQYREEYAQRLRDAISQGITQLSLRNYQNFLSRIDEAITQQRQVVQNSEQSTKNGQEHWKNQNKRLKAINTLSVRHDVKIRELENKQEQKLLDEFSSRRYQTSQKED
jgi:flagellar FliJ protein